MGKKIKTTDLNLNVSTGTMIYMDIDIFRFIYDSEIFCITVQFLDGEDYKFLEEINLGKDKSNLDHNDLKTVGLDWIKNNVEVISNLEKEVAPEVSVQKQPKIRNINLKQVIRELQEILVKHEIYMFQVDELLQKLKLQIIHDTKIQK